MKSIHRANNTVQQSSVNLSLKPVKAQETLPSTKDSFTPLSDQPAQFQKTLKQQNVVQNYKTIKKETKHLWGKPLDESHLEPPLWEAVIAEEDFKAHPTTAEFLKLGKEFSHTMLTVGHPKYHWIERIAVDASTTLQLHYGTEQPDAHKTEKLEQWHHHQEKKFSKRHEHACKKTQKRNQKIEEKGLGHGGKMTSVIGDSKAFAFHAKNNYTIRGNVFKLTHKTFAKNLDEIMPRYDYRKSAHMGVRIVQFGLNGLVFGLGYALIPISFGISKIVADHLNVTITLSGEAITHKIAGAKKDKIAFHSGLRGVQLEIPRLVPVVGDIVTIGETIAMGSAAAGIVSTTIADMILQKISTRYKTTMNLDDLGDSSCLEQMNQRIDYLSRFLLPYGQYLLLHETHLDERARIKKMLKKQFKNLRHLEKKKMCSLNFYRLALAADKIPIERRGKIEADCNNALSDLRVNTHRRVRACLARLMERDGKDSAKISQRMAA